MCLARTGAPDPSEDPLFPPKEDIERLRSSTVDDAQPRSLSASEQRLIASEHNGDAVDRSQVATTKLLSERTPEGGNQRPPPGFRNPPQFNSRAALESSPGFERPYEGVLRPPQEKTMPPEERVAAWICSETSDEVPDLEEAEKEMYRGEEEEVETSGFGKSSSQEASTLSSENSGNYHSFGEAQVPIKELLKSKMPF